MKAFLFCIVIACALAVIAGNATGKKKESSSSSSEEDKKAKNGTKPVIKPSAPTASNIKAQSGDAPPTPPNGNKQASADSVAPAIKAAATDSAKAPSGNSETTTAANRGKRYATKDKSSEEKKAGGASTTKSAAVAASGPSAATTHKPASSDSAAPAPKVASEGSAHVTKPAAQGSVKAPAGNAETHEENGSSTTPSSRGKRQCTGRGNGNGNANANGVLNNGVALNNTNGIDIRNQPIQNAPGK